MTGTPVDMFLYLITNAFLYTPYTERVQSSGEGMRRSLERKISGAEEPKTPFPIDANFAYTSMV